jgi:hypothetical protein
VSVRRLACALVLSSLALGACGPDTPRVGLGAGPTSPTGSTHDTAAALPHELMQDARRFRGNPILLGVFVGTLLLIGLGLAAFTISFAYRHPPRTGR